MRLFAIVFVVALAATLAVSSVQAHHSFAAQFDPDKPLTLEGVITKVEWRSPHIWVYLDVADEEGAVEKWECEGGAPNALTRSGWSRATLELGTSLTIFGYQARNGTNTCNAREWTYNGKTVFAGDNTDGGPTAERSR